MAISDSLVASFYNKYQYIFWLPENTIHAGDTDGNPKTEADPNFLPFIVTPCFPSYPSNHGSGSNGGAEVLRRLYGEGGHSITVSNSAVPNIVLQYTRFKQITNDISDGHVYGGIWRNTFPIRPGCRREPRARPGWRNRSLQKQLASCARSRVI